MKSMWGVINKFNKDDTTGIINNGYINAAGRISDNNLYYVSAPISVVANKRYTWQFGGTTTHTAPTVGFYNSSDNLISVASHSTATYFSFTTPNNCAYIKASVYKSTVNEAMLVEGTNFIETYHPYYEWVEG